HRAVGGRDGGPVHPDLLQLPHALRDVQVRDLRRPRRAGQGSGEVTQRPLEQRDAARARALAQAPQYRPWLHVGTESLIGVAICAAAAWLARGAGPWHLAFFGVLLVLSNATEWSIHRDVLHVRRRGLEVLYDRHTPIHHVIYVTGDMAMRSARELQLVLIPAYGILLVFLFTLPVSALLWWLG